MSHTNKKKIAVAGREKQTAGYVRALEHLCSGQYNEFSFEVSLTLGNLSSFDALLLPGGGDIDPALFGCPDCGSRSIDTELDLLQLQALDLFVKSGKPVAGICKGFQVIHVYFGGMIEQDLGKESFHNCKENGGDAYHPLTPAPGCKALKTAALLPEAPVVNSAHHQSVSRAGRDMALVHIAADGVPETSCHLTLPILAAQWHPERLLFQEDAALSETGLLFFQSFFSLL